MRIRKKRERRYRPTAVELCDELLTAYPDVELLDPRFLSEEVLELLLDIGEEVPLESPEQALVCAEIALEVGEALREKAFLESDAKVRAACLRGTAQRLKGELAEAERSFNLARIHLEDVSPVRPLFCRSLALLRWEQHRLDEAMGLLQHSVWLWLLTADGGREAAACQLLLGLLESETAVAGLAIPRLSHGRRRSRPERHPWLSLCGGFTLARLLAEHGEEQRGREVLAQTMKLYALVRDERQTLQGCRLEGAARAVLGEIGEAENILEGVRRKHLERRDLAELALTSLELGTTLANLGRTEEIERLARDIAESFTADRAVALAVSLLTNLRTCVLRGEPAPACAAWCAAEFRRHGRLLDLAPLGPIPFA